MHTPDSKKGSGRPTRPPAPAAPRRLDGATAAWLAERVAPGGGALPFAEAVTLQLARRGSAGGEVGIGTARRVADLLRAPTEGGAAARLAADPEMLSSFFQNVDLLYEHAFPGADAVSLLVMSALEILDHSA